MKNKAPQTQEEETGIVQETECDKRLNNEKKTRKKYYIKIASCPEEIKAKEYIRRLERKGRNNISILEKSNKYRLYLDSFDSKEEATDFLNQFRDTTSFKDAWLLAHKS